MSYLGWLPFNVCIFPASSILLQDSILVEVLSSPMGMKSEYEGRKLSQENRMPPGGMGQPPTNGRDASRTTHLMQKVYIEGDDGIIHPFK